MRKTRNGAGTAATLLLAVASANIHLATDADARARLSQWETIQSSRHGFQIAYPGSVFAPQSGAASDDGHVFVSRDGAARLLVGAFENETSATLREYRTQLLDENYKGADLDYAPMRKRSFIISGTQGEMHFYERVSFTCGGRLINSWALLYPVAERHIYDRIVEAIARTYSPGAGRTGQCD